MTKIMVSPSVKNLQFRLNLFMYYYYFHILLSAFLSGVDGSSCRNYNYIQNDAAVGETSQAPHTELSLIEYTCPRPIDPPHLSECCSSEGQPGCCGHAKYFYEIEKTLAMTIAISVTSVCVILTITIIVCCFCSKCPLYSACRTEYSHDVATYVSKTDYVDMETMPRELSGRGSNKFSPIVMSNGNLPLGAEIDTM